MGEFEKRIKKLIKEGAEGSASAPTTIWEHELEPIFEEAKKEFPKLEQIEKEYKIINKATHTEPEILGVWVTLASKQREWFVKWLADDEEARRTSP